ncbi:MAG TPA: RidA family protein [Chloroflexota bacterium]|jgi:2-iminobutanoate/2-iminopropanoate deaminase|nr:RidA family protein [Chloroflexota bacterium]
MSAEHIQPSGLPTPPTYSHVVRCGNTVYLAGQTAQNERGEVIGQGDVTAQAEQVFANLGKCLASVGGDFSNLVKITVYVCDARYRESVAAVRAKYLKPPLPASTFIVVAGLANPDYMLEIEGIAVID